MEALGDPNSSETHLISNLMHFTSELSNLYIGLRYTITCPAYGYFLFGIPTFRQKTQNRSTAEPAENESERSEKAKGGRMPERERFPG